MHEIQFENRRPNELAIPELHLNMHERVRTLNGNVLTVQTTGRGVSIADYTLLAPDTIGVGHPLPMYMFSAYIERPGLLRAIIRSRAPGDWPSRKHPDIRPAEQMRQTIDYLDEVGNPVEVFRSNWTVDDPSYPTNAMLFRQHMNDPALRTLSGTERQRIAALRTPTGKMMTLLGFDLDVDSVIDHGHVIEANFLKVRDK